MVNPPGVPNPLAVPPVVNPPGVPNPLAVPPGIEPSLDIPAGGVAKVVLLAGVEIVEGVNICLLGVCGGGVAGMSKSNGENVPGVIPVLVERVVSCIGLKKGVSAIGVTNDCNSGEVPSSVPPASMLGGGGGGGRLRGGRGGGCLLLPNRALLLPKS